jgi:hypothetical protein
LGAVENDLLDVLRLLDEQNRSVGRGGRTWRAVEASEVESGDEGMSGGVSHGVELDLRSR